VNVSCISQKRIAVVRVHSVLEKSLKMLKFTKKNSRPLKVLENLKMDEVLESTGK